MAALPARSVVAFVAMTANWCSADALPAEIARRIAEDLRPIRRYTCLETIHRTRLGDQCSDCTVQDRLRTQVLFADGQEFTAWPGDGRFEAVTADNRVSDGMVVLGHFAGMAGTLFLTGTASFHDRGEAVVRNRHVRLFSFSVPSIGSELQIQNGELRTTVGYRGSVTLDGSNNDLQELTLELHKIPEWIGIRDARTRILYERRKSNTHEPLLPLSTESMMRFESGVVSRNRTEYENCREFTAESTIHGGDAPVAKTAVQTSVPPPAAFPAGVSLDLRLKDPVQVEQVAVGDLVRFRIDKVTTGDHEIASGDEVIARVIHFRQVGTLRKRLKNVRTATSVGFELLSVGSGGRSVPIKASLRSLTGSGTRNRDLHESREGNRVTLTWSGHRNLGRDVVFRWVTEN